MSQIFDPNKGEFVKQFSACQSAVYAFALSLLGDPDAASDVQQETNVVLWQKAEESSHVDNFNAWVMKIAYYQVQNYRRKMHRQPMLFDDEVLDLMAAESAEVTADFDDRLRALHHCIEQLSDGNRELLTHRYSRGASVKSIAEKLCKPAGRIGVALFRIRAALFACVTRRMQEGDF